ncbi:MAG TPA: hypothetical protein VNS34_08075 [Rhizobiaceae bacterium]|nr:hypothetical protein [Rhizobiaceae bacterium]
MKTRRIATMAALAAAVLLAGCVEGGYYAEVGGPVVYGPGYVEPYYGGYYPRYGGYYPRYDGYRYRRYDRHYDRPRRPDYVARPGRPRPPRQDFARPSRPAPVAIQPRPQAPRALPNLPRGRTDCSGPGCSGLRGRGEPWGGMD